MYQMDKSTRFVYMMQLINNTVVDVRLRSDVTMGYTVHYGITCGKLHSIEVGPNVLTHNLPLTYNLQSLRATVMV